MNPEYFNGKEPVQSAEQERKRIRLETAHRLLDDFVNIKAGERLLFLTDNNPVNTDRELIELLKTDLKGRDNPFDEIVADEKLTAKELFKKVKQASVVWVSWDMNNTKIDFDDLTDLLERTGNRMVFSPAIRVESLDIDGALADKLEDIVYRLGKMENQLREVAGFTIQTSYGTNLTIALKQGERRWFKDTGVIPPGGWDNLPGGEIFTTPDEENVNGVLVLPVLQDEVTLDQGVDQFVRLTIRNGKIAKIDGGVSADKLREYLERHSREEKIDPTNVLQCAEIAFGANSKARSVVSNTEGNYTDQTNPTAETEKRLGTMHLAFGDSKHGEIGTEGHNETESSMHLDFVIPRNGLTVVAYKGHDDFIKKQNGKRLIDEGSWNFLD
jgi:leucyl aminopeptidase (aminopeptidase T)